MTLLLVGLGWLLASVLFVVGWSRWQRARKRQQLMDRVADALLVQGQARAQVAWVIYATTGRQVSVRQPETFIEAGSWSN